MNEIVVDDMVFTQVSSLRQAGKVLEETFFANDLSGLKVQIDYRFTDKGHK